VNIRFNRESGDMDSSKDKLKYPDWFRETGRNCPICGSSDFLLQWYPPTISCSGALFGDAPSSSSSSRHYYACLGCENEVSINAREISVGDRECSSGSYSSIRVEEIHGNKLEKTDGGFTTSATRNMEYQKEKDGEFPVFI